ncbi:PKD domain-containing protein [Mucilaginibacter lacusdianchii]|uniref:PKD domain-containing protein n=1 Tax=Mucilaginibacter lacusdianchii TaxID=2684211 RepID=UPI00131B8091|nr:PKD domain-containing protein [Mucilaginibacter sp. JXJ CY 39]
MDNRFTKVVSGFFALILLLVFAAVAQAQTVSIRSVDPGPYAPGSSIAALINVTDENGNINVSGNSYDLYLSDANGNFTTETKIGTFSGYYTGFVNGLIPANTPVGSGYKLRIKTTRPVTTSEASSAFTINAGTGVKAAASAPTVNDNYPEVFGTCFGMENNPLIFQNETTDGSTVTASFYNDLTQAMESSNVPLAPTTTFNAKTANYSVLIKAVNNGIVGTKAYLILNNFISNSFQTQNSASVCLPDNQKASVSYSVNITGLGGIQTNYPGTIYTINWGDGTSSALTYFQIKATNGVLTHDYAISSCGAKNAEGQITNKFQISFKVSPPYCPDQAKTLSGDQAVLSPPKNIINGPSLGCTGTTVTFTNASFAGQVVSPGAGARSCENVNATYQWYVNGVAVGRANVKRGDPFVYTFPSAGTYRVGLKLTSTGSPCTTPDAETTICISDPPKPAFTLPAVKCISDGPIAPVDQSVVVNNCNTAISYTWEVTPSVGVSFAPGTNANSKAPKFVFNTPGRYSVVLKINNGSCDPVASTPQTILISDDPKAVLSADFSVCGNNKTLNFDATDGSQTKTILTGTAEPTTTTFQWTVTPVGNLAPAEFVNGTTANSQYPQIKFPAYGTYEVKVTHTNDCNTVTSNVQHITFLLAPTVNAGADLRICPTENTVALNGSVSDTYVSARWTTTGTGTFSDPTVLNPTYTPSAADKTSGEVRLTLTVTTNLPGECKTIPDEMVLTINPANTVNSAAAKTICTESFVNYTPTSTVAGSTFTWTVANASNVSGYSASGSGTINDALTVTSNNIDGKITYRIIPRANNCDGTPFDLVVTVRPKPVLTKPADKSICSGGYTAIPLQSNVHNLQYTWTSSTTGDISGASVQATPASLTTINDVLTNNGTTAATVTYTITPVTAASDNNCGGLPQTVTITVQPTTPAANAGADIMLCNQPSYQLKGNDPGTFSGRWSGPTDVTFADATKFNTTVSGLKPGQTYTFTWTINGQSPCASTSDEVKIINNAPIANNTISSGDQTTCSGQTIVLTGSTPTGGSGAYTYQWEMSSDNVTWTPVPNAAGKNLNFVIQTSTYFRRSVNAGVCTDDKSNVIQVNTLPGISDNTISGASQTCVNTTAGVLNGLVPNGGGGNYAYQWQSSTNGTTWTNIPGATDVSYATPILTATIQYRRLVSTVVCSGTQSNSSNVITITVNPNAKAEFTWTKDAECVPFRLTNQVIKAVTYADRNGTYTWYANGTVIGTGANFPGYTINNDGQSVEIKLEVTSKFGCQPDVFAHTFTTTKAVQADFTQSVATGCGSTTVKFTNTSTPLGGATYIWDFGNGQTSDKVQPDQVTFAAGTDGRDKVYTVTLTAVTSCSRLEHTSTVIVKPATPVALISPALNRISGCVPFTATVSNISPGTNTQYIYHVLNAATNTEISTFTRTVTDNSPQDFVFDTPGKYKVYMEAVSECSRASSQPITFEVTQATLFSGLDTAPGQTRRGCAPFTAEFVNTSQGQGSISYVYDWGDGSKTNASDTRNLTHTFTQPGEYLVRLYATNACTINSASEVIKITVDALPKPDFVYTASESPACYSCTVVQFTNKTTDASGNVYTWNFGDAANSSSSNPNISNDRNPIHTFDYNKGGTYSVTLTVKNANDCGATITHTVTIQQPNTTVFLPNAFMPNGNNLELRTFAAKGSGMASWHMRVFNNYGQLIWETDKLDSRGAPTEGWDGTFKGVPVPQGVYIWQADATFIDGQQWKGMSYNGSNPSRTGAIHLIR